MLRVLHGTRRDGHSMAPLRWLLAMALVMGGGDAMAQDEPAAYTAAWEAFDRGDHAAALELFEQAAAQGSAKAAHNLGAIYEEGKATTRDRGRALEWYRKAAELGSARSMHNLGVYHEKGTAGVKADPAEALRWFQKAADAGLSNSQYQVGIYYAEGKGVAQDEARALEFFKRAAGQGHEDARKKSEELQRDLAGAVTTAGTPASAAPVAPAGGDADEKLFQRAMAMLRKKDLAEEDRKKALRAIAAVAGRGHPEAQFTLGVIFIKGKGVPANEARGRAWLKKAADAGHTKAAKALQALAERPKAR